MRGLLESIFFPFFVNQKLWWIIITGLGLSLLIKFAMDYQLAKIHAQTAHTFLSGLEPYRLIKRSNYLIIGILIWTLIASIREGFVAQRFHNYMILKVLIIFLIQN